MPEDSPEFYVIEKPVTSTLNKYLVDTYEATEIFLGRDHLVPETVKRAPTLYELEDALAYSQQAVQSLQEQIDDAPSRIEEIKRDERRLGIVMSGITLALAGLVGANMHFDTPPADLAAGFVVSSAVMGSGWMIWYSRRSGIRKAAAEAKRIERGVKDLDRNKNLQTRLGAAIAALATDPASTAADTV